MVGFCHGGNMPASHGCDDRDDYDDGDDCVDYDDEDDYDDYDSLGLAL